MTKNAIIAFCLGALIGQPIALFIGGVTNAIVIGITGHDTRYYGEAVGTALRQVFVKDEAQ